MASIIPKGGRLLGFIVPDLVIKEETTDGWEVTTHPVQQGASISDHKYRKPVTLKMSMMFKEGNTADLNMAYQKLLALEATSELFDVITPKRIYTNMQLISLSCQTDQYTENVLAITGDLQEVIIVDVATTSVPPREKHQDAKKTGGTAKTGTKSAKPKGTVSSSPKSSISKTGNSTSTAKKADNSSILFNIKGLL
jgi:hypothetical protein